MNLPTCKIIRGKAFNIKENTNSPLEVLKANLEPLQELIDYALLPYSKRICFVGSSCMYPMREGALREEMLGTGEVYEGNSLYAYIKLLGWQICKAKRDGQFFVVIPSDIFGNPNDSHFIPQIMRKMHNAKLAGESKLSFWGTGTAIRHPLFEDDFEKILKWICERYMGADPINIAPPVSYAKSVLSITRDIQDIVDYRGDIEWDGAYSDGQKIKILDNTRLRGFGLPHGDADFTPWQESLAMLYERMKNEA